MKKVVCFNQKGGTGKSVSVVNICGCLDTDFKKKSLVIDCDSQCNSSNYLLTSSSSSSASVADVLNDIIPITDAIIPVSFIKSGKTVASRISLLKASKEIDYMDSEDFSLLKEKLIPVEKRFDYCFFDCPPHLSNLTLMALASADYVIVPALADTDSLGGYGQLIDTINGIRSAELNLSLKILGIFFNNVDFTRALDKYIYNELISNMGESVFKSYIKRSSLIPQARFYGLPMAYYKNSSECEKQYAGFVREMNRKIKLLEKEK